MLKSFCFSPLTIDPGFLARLLYYTFKTNFYEKQKHNLLQQKQSAKNTWAPHWLRPANLAQRYFCDFTQSCCEKSHTEYADAAFRPGIPAVSLIINRLSEPAVPVNSATTTMWINGLEIVCLHIHTLIYFFEWRVIIKVKGPVYTGPLTFNEIIFSILSPGISNIWTFFKPRAHYRIARILFMCIISSYIKCDFSSAGTTCFRTERWIIDIVREA